MCLCQIWVNTLSKLIITSMNFRGREYRICAVSENNRIMEVQIEKEGTVSCLGNIYTGVVEKINSNIQAAFVRFSENETGYFPLMQTPDVCYAAGFEHEGPLKTGDQILVQIDREAMKGKLPALSANLSFTGKYMVLTSANKKFGLSKKLDAEAKARLTKWFLEDMKEDTENAGQSYGCIIRTNAAEAEKAEILREYAYLKRLYERTVVYGKMRTPGSLLLQQEPFYLTAIRDSRFQELEEIVTDLPEAAEEIRAYLKDFCPEEEKKVRLYQDSLLPLFKLYRLETALEEVCQKKIWLKSGGFLVIEQTEAFVSVDVNTGKYTDHKKVQETYRKINHEAAQELIRQLRLRNLSGMILVDFINMENPDHRDELFHVLKKLVRKDSVKTSVIDLTQLNIVEMTRKKVRRPVIEVLSENN